MSKAISNSRSELLPLAFELLAFYIGPLLDGISSSKLLESSDPF